MRRLPLPGRLRTLRMSAVAMMAVVATSAGCADASKAGAKAAADPAFEAKVHAYLVAHPEVIQEAIDALQTKQRAQAEIQARQSISEHRKELVAMSRDPSLGGGPVTVVEFFDYRCGFCKAAAPHIPEMVAGAKSIRLVFKEFPILSPISDTAARAALAAAKQDKYLPVHLAFMAEKALDEAAIDRILKAKGVDLDRAHADMKSPEIEAEIAENKALARTIGIDGTPSFIVGDRVFGGFLEDDILAEVKAEARTPQSTPAAKGTGA